MQRNSEHRQRWTGTIEHNSSIDERVRRESDEVRVIADGAVDAARRVLGRADFGRAECMGALTVRVWRTGHGRGAVKPYGQHTFSVDFTRIENR